MYELMYDILKCICRNPAAHMCAAVGETPIRRFIFVPFNFSVFIPFAVLLVLCLQRALFIRLGFYSHLNVNPEQ